MIRFKQFIAEAFDSSYPIETISTDRDGNREIYRFKDRDNFVYEVHLNINSMNALTVGFAIKNNDGSYMSDPSGKSSNALKVYSTIGKIIERFIGNKNDIKSIKFSAYSPKTHKVYDGLARLIAKKLDGKVKHSGTIWVIAI